MFRFWKKKSRCEEHEVVIEDLVKKHDELLKLAPSPITEKSMKQAEQNFDELMEFFKESIEKGV